MIVHNNYRDQKCNLMLGCVRFAEMDWNIMDFMRDFKSQPLPWDSKIHQTWDFKGSLGFQNLPISNVMTYQTHDWNGFEIQILSISIPKFVEEYLRNWRVI